MRDYVIINMTNVIHQNTRVAFSHSCVGTPSRLILQPLLHILLPFIVVLIDTFTSQTLALYTPLSFFTSSFLLL